MAAKSTTGVTTRSGGGSGTGGRGKKVFAGPRLRRLRREQGLTQVSYLEHEEDPIRLIQETYDRDGGWGWDSEPVWEREDDGDEWR